MNGKLVDTNVIIRYIKDEDALDDIFEEENLYFLLLHLENCFLVQNVLPENQRMLMFTGVFAANLKK